MKRLFFLVLALLPFSAFAFSDTQKSEFKPYIDNMVDENIISGYSDGTFRPNNPVRFAEALKIAISTRTGNQYSDDGWEDMYIRIYKELGYTQSEKLFNVQDSISRDFAIYILLRVIGVDLSGIPVTNTFSDVDENSIFSPYINFAKNRWIIGGYGNGKFWPNNPVTRGEFAKMAWSVVKEKWLELFVDFEFGNLYETRIKDNPLAGKTRAEQEEFAKELKIFIKEVEAKEESKPQKTVSTHHSYTKVKITGVADGDTVRVLNEEWKVEKIRILGFDAPESFDTRFGYIECYGKEASDFLKNYLLFGTEVEIKYYGNDKYNRDLAEIFYNGESIAKTMLKNGYGWVYRGGIEPSNYAELLEIEKSLKGSSVGLWSYNTCNGERKPVEKEITTTYSNYSSSSSSYSSPNCYTGPRWGRYYYNSKGKKVYGC